VPIRFTLGSRARNEDGTARQDASRVLASLVRAVMHLPDDVLLTISEIDCGDPECGGAETVVLVMRPGLPTAAFKIRMPMLRVEEGDILAAATQAGMMPAAQP
jgi:hypothetical protein